MPDRLELARLAATAPAHLDVDPERFHFFTIAATNSTASGTPHTSSAMRAVSGTGTGGGGSTLLTPAAANAWRTTPTNAATHAAEHGSPAGTGT
jgi:hypothetical protein